MKNLINRLWFAVTQNSISTVFFWLGTGIGIYAGVVYEPFLLWWCSLIALFFIASNYISYPKD